MPSLGNTQCLQVLKNISKKQSFTLQNFKEATSRGLPSTARKSTFTDQQSRDFIQTVRCKEITKYLMEEAPSLTEQSSLSLQQSQITPNDQPEYHQIDAIFTELEDRLIQIKSTFTSKVKASLSNQYASRKEKKMKCQQHLKDMKNFFHYFKQITSTFVQPHTQERQN